MKVIPEGEVITRSESSTESSDKCCCTPWRVWMTVCRSYYKAHCVFFRVLTNLIIRHPYPTIGISLVFVATLSVGFMRFDFKSRADKLFIPQNSQAIKDLDRADEYYPLKTRAGVVIIFPQNGDSVLTEDCFKAALTTHNIVIDIDGYSELCRRVNTLSANGKMTRKCFIYTPLEVFGFDERNFTNIPATLTASYKDPNYIDSNGRPPLYNFPNIFAGLKKNGTTGEILSAKAMRMVFYLKDKPEIEDRVMNWEKNFLEKLSELKSNLKNVRIVYSADRSLDDSIRESSLGDIFLFIGTMGIMILFSSLALGKFRNPVTGHSLLSCFGLFSVGLGILAGFGLSMLAGVPFVSIMGILPFLVIGIGIDDMFIILDEFDRHPPGEKTETKITNTMSHIGATITMTTLTDLMAFAVSTSSQLPGIAYFCAFAALSLLFAFLLLITLFVVGMMCESKRIKNNRRDLFPICTFTKPLPLGANTTPMSNKIMLEMGKFIMKPVMKVTLVILAVGLLVAGSIGAANITEEFSPQMLAKDGSPFIEFLDTLDEHFPEQSMEVSIILDSDANYSSERVQKEIVQLSNIASENRYFANYTTSWIHSYHSWAKKLNINTTGFNFMPTLKKFLSIPQFVSYRMDVMLNSNETTVVASRILAYYHGTFSAIDQRDAMLSLREDLATKSPLSVFPIHKYFIYFEQYAITLQETIRNLTIASLTILIITSPSLAHPGVILLVFLSFVSLIFELFGLMYLWDISLNSISMLILVMAIGFAVDYSAHVAHAFVFSTKSTAEDRAVEAVGTVGASVFMGGLSTFFGMVIMAFASSEAFRTFFRMFFGIVVLGLLHGLVFLPVLLTIFCRCRMDLRELPTDDESQVKQNSPTLRWHKAEGSSNKEVTMMGDISNELILENTNTDSVQENSNPGLKDIKSENDNIKSHSHQQITDSTSYHGNTNSTTEQGDKNLQSDHNQSSLSDCVNSNSVPDHGTINSPTEQGTTNTISEQGRNSELHNAILKPEHENIRINTELS